MPASLIRNLFKVWFRWLWLAKLNLNYIHWLCACKTSQILWLHEASLISGYADWNRMLWQMDRNILSLNSFLNGFGRISDVKPTVKMLIIEAISSRSNLIGKEKPTSRTTNSIQPEPRQTPTTMSVLETTQFRIYIRKEYKTQTINGISRLKTN